MGSPPATQLRGSHRLGLPEARKADTPESTFDRADRPETVGEVRDQFFPIPDGPMSFLSQTGRIDVPGFRRIHPLTSDAGEVPPHPDPPSPGKPS